MKIRYFSSIALLTVAISFIACNNDSTEKKTDMNETEAKPVKIKEEAVTYSLDTFSMKGFVAYDENKEGTRPLVLVIPEWWGLTDYAQMRARKLAELGYLAMAVDFYGNGKTADNPDLAGKLASPYYTNPQLAKARFDAAVAKLKTYSQADTSKVAVIGYCFGGAMALNIARLGDDLDGAVSFHGNLVGVPPNKSLLKAQITVFHGADDQFVKPAEVDQFKHQMDSAGISYGFKSFPGATHAFSNPGATELGKKFNIPIAYNEAADTASWNGMKDFFNTIFAKGK